MSKSQGAPEHPPGRPRAAASSEGQVWWTEEAEAPGLFLGESGPQGVQLAPRFGATPAESPEAPAASALHPQEQRGILDWTQFPVLLWLVQTCLNTGSSFRGCGGLGEGASLTLGSHSSSSKPSLQRSWAPGALAGTLSF